VAASKLQLPERKRTYRFALTPLADAMFQLLIFFMLSSSLTPYSMLTLQTAPEMPDAAATASSAPGPGPGAPAPSGALEIWRVDRDVIIANGQRLTFDQLDSLAEALGTTGRPAQVVLIVLPGARVQDVSTVLARLQRADVMSLQVSRGEG
jgi:biopolymer transport protein ExbD